MTDEHLQRYQVERVTSIRRWIQRQRLGCKVHVPDDLAPGARPRIPPEGRGSEAPCCSGETG